MSKYPLSSSVEQLVSAGPSMDTHAAETTGRYIVTFREGAIEQGVSVLKSKARLRVASAADFDESAVNFEALGNTDVLALPELGIAVATGEPDQIESMSAQITEDSVIVSVEPEHFVYALGAPAPLAPETPEAEPVPPPATELSPAAASYLRGYRDALDHLASKMLAGGLTEAAVQPAAVAERQFTWGLQATRVHLSSLSGRGINVAVLDTGMDLNHPDFAGRAVFSRSFIPNEPVQDGHGHGTHCIGTACGPRKPAIPPRYGIAYESAIYAGKVLSNAGSGTDAGILAGINWAIANGCPVISMSLGRRAAPGEPYSVAYETAARAALARGCLIVAAAGNDSRRSTGLFVPVSHPANCPSILSVGAIDSGFRIADFSNRAINSNGGAVDMVGPGVAIRSSWPMPQRYRSISGTSMATPHVAGIAALLAQTSPLLRGAALWLRLAKTARNLVAIPVVDDGWGVVQAP